MVKYGPILTGDWLDGIAELSKSLQQMDIDASAYACLSALTLVSGKCGAELILSPHPSQR